MADLAEIKAALDDLRYVFTEDNNTFLIGADPWTGREVLVRHPVGRYTQEQFDVWLTVERQKLLAGRVRLHEPGCPFNPDDAIALCSCANPPINDGRIHVRFERSETVIDRWPRVTYVPVFSGRAPGDGLGTE